MEDAWLFFLYSIYNKQSQHCIIQPSGNPTVINFPLGPTMVGTVIWHWVWENHMKLLYVIQVLLWSPPAPTSLINVKENITANLRTYFDYWQQKQPNDVVLGRLLFKVPSSGDFHFVQNCFMCFIASWKRFVHGMTSRSYLWCPLGKSFRKVSVFAWTNPNWKFVKAFCHKFADNFRLMKGFPVNFSFLPIMHP